MEYINRIIKIFIIQKLRRCVNYFSRTHAKLKDKRQSLDESISKAKLKSKSSMDKKQCHYPTA